MAARSHWVRIESAHGVVEMKCNLSDGLDLVSCLVGNPERLLFLTVVATALFKKPSRTVRGHASL